MSFRTTAASTPIADGFRNYLKGSILERLEAP
jgi:hypothetical protein